MSMVSSLLLEKRISALVALAVLIAIADVLISPAVPSAPTLLPVSALLLVGLIIISSHAAVHVRCPLPVLLKRAELISPTASLEFVTAARPLRC